MSIVHHRIINKNTFDFKKCTHGEWRCVTIVRIRKDDALVDATTARIRNANA